MVIKSLIIIVLTALISSGVVFYGGQAWLSPHNNGQTAKVVKISHPHGPTPAKKPTKPQEPKSPQTAMDDDPTGEHSMGEDNHAEDVSPKYQENPSGSDTIPEITIIETHTATKDTNQAPDVTHTEYNELVNRIRITAQREKEDAQNAIGILMDQATSISDENMQDQAYLDIVIYALRYGFIDDAKQAMQKINQVELKETARSRIAIALAQSGDIQAAFAVVDDVEIPDLKDVMRLQVIETITLPGFSPMVEAPPSVPSQNRE